MVELYISYQLIMKKHFSCIQGVTPYTLPMTGIGTGIPFFLNDGTISYIKIGTLAVTMIRTLIPKAREL